MFYYANETWRSTSRMLIHGVNPIPITDLQTPGIAVPFLHWIA